MASQEIQSVKNYWDGMANVKERPTIETMRLNDHYWAGLTGEPGDVDYIEAVVGNIPALWAVPKGAVWDRTVVCFHGGGYMMGSRYSHRKVYSHIAKAIGCRALIIDYRLTPEHPHPAQSDDAIAAYRWLLESGVSPNHIILTGDSAGGGLTLGTLIRIRDIGLPLPAGAVAMSAWTDMTLSGASYDNNAPKDLVFHREMVGGLAHLLLGANGNAADPYASPLAADLRGLPPVYLQVGGDECLLDDSVVFVDRAKKAGVNAQLDVFPEMLHSFQMAAGRAPEADLAISRIAEWACPLIDLPAK
jgi:acetyl esterase/lipase